MVIGRPYQLPPTGPRRVKVAYEPGTRLFPMIASSGLGVPSTHSIRMSGAALPTYRGCSHLECGEIGWDHLPGCQSARKLLSPYRRLCISKIDRRPDSQLEGRYVSLADTKLSRRVYRSGWRQYLDACNVWRLSDGGAKNSCPCQLRAYAVRFDRERLLCRKARTRVRRSNVKIQRWPDANNSLASEFGNVRHAHHQKRCCRDLCGWH